MSTESRGQLVYRPEHVVRRHVRVPVQLTVRYQVGDVGRWVTGRSVNMSLGGLCIAAEVLPLIGTPIEVEIFRRDKPFARASGVVRWIRPTPTIEGDRRAFGIELTSTSETTTARMSELIDAHLNDRLETIDADVKQKNAVNWRWLLVGGAVILSAVAFIAYSVLMH